MEERSYQVQEAVRLIGVESHVLRYWEEELGITVGRTKQGYRLYSEKNIRLFRQVKELKRTGDRAESDPPAAWRDGGWWNDRAGSTDGKPHADRGSGTW